MRIYFDMNIYNRIFDDQSQMRIRFESLAIDILFELIENGEHILVWSFILDYENSRNPYVDRKMHIQSISTLCKETIKPHDEIKRIAVRIIRDSNANEKDALHLASAIYSKCDYFVTCDDKFIKTINNNQEDLKGIIGSIKIFNPIDLLRKELDINVIE